jgi:hypothetical protein
MMCWWEMGAWVVGVYIGMLGSPIVEGSKVRGRPGVLEVVGVDEGTLCCSAMSKGEGAQCFWSLTWSRR